MQIYFKFVLRFLNNLIISSMIITRAVTAKTHKITIVVMNIALPPISRNERIKNGMRITEIPIVKYKNSFRYEKLFSVEDSI